ncbi:AMP-binding protein [Nocardioides sp.]|uniref:class I adenylate-forming enzyme family protein n=1 Tax=Nocardioides sp. TaxID=35761 RepID=UPI001A322544|nr:AMP-binding protein [Nocardioides sp.]MBJ7355777.1 AMP-binding protein [Nocardioides sp.]
MNAGANAADYLLEQGSEGDVALVDGGRHHTYGELRAASGVLAAELAALGLPAGARVGVLGSNSLFWVAAYLAAIKLDLVAVPFSDKLTPADVSRNARLVRLDVVLADRRTLRRFDSAFGAEVPVLTDEALTAPRDPFWPDSTTDPDGDAVLMFTSGTTATPRAVRVTHRNMRANTDSIVDYLGLRRDDRALVILPFSYCYGASILHTHLRAGARVVLCHSFVYPETAIELLDKEGCTVLAGVPSSFQLLLRASTFASRRLPSLRLVQQAGGKLSPVLIEELRAAQPQAELFVMYGATEATARLSYLPPERLGDKLGSIGRGIPGVELRVLDEQGRRVAPGERGEIYARGDNISPGYLDAPEATAAKFTPDGLRTGDVAVVDDEGFIFIVDRVADFIKTWGHRVSSQEVEACALRLDGLVSAAAVGVPDEEAGEAVALFVTLAPGADVGPEEIRSFMRAQLPKHMVPSTVVILDALPLTANGKTAKASLRELASAPDPVGHGVG